ncbi:MAG: hypothetical protein D6681_16555 [Calditrichaeota bacterium]|nr:MAG: hypothetical protein D6681_16555 [Calditrichota bacterium]
MTVNRLHKTYWLLLGGFFLVIAWVTTAPAQIGLNHFPAGAANLYEWRASLVNPSLGAYQHGAVEAGFKLMHLGFLDGNATAFKATYALVHLPRWLPHRLAFSARVQHFSGPLLQEFELGVALSRQFWRRFSLGVSLGVRNFSYNREAFDLVDPDDPVFAGGTSRWQPDVAVGLTYIGAAPLIIGVGVTHLNRPAVSLAGDAVRLTPRVHVGVAVHLGGSTVHGGGMRTEHTVAPRGFWQLYGEDVGLLQIGVGNQDAWLRGRLRVRGPVSIGYGFSYPVTGLAGATVGSHEAFVTYEFDRLRKVPPLETPPVEWNPFLPGISRIDVVPQYYTAANVEALDIFEKRLVREVSEELTPEQLARLNAYDLGVLDSSRVDRPFPFELEPVTLPEIGPEDSVRYSREYLRSLKRLRAALQQQEGNPDIVVIAPKTQRKRAALLEKELAEQQPDSAGVQAARPRFANPEDSLRWSRPVSLEELQKSEELVILRPQRVLFHIYPVLPEKLDPHWKLVIEDQQGRVVRTFTGTSAEQQVVAWNWRDSQGRIIEPGFYRYYIAWRDARGQERHSPARTIYARQLKRRIHIKVTRRFTTPEGDVNSIGIILNKSTSEE